MDIASMLKGKFPGRRPMTTHRFEPTIYHNLIGPLPPVLHIAPGDRVHTTTADAHGYDANLEKVAESPNPMTGPFYIEGAEPGDTLAVHLEAAAPNRDSGWTSSVLRPNVVEPAHVKDLPKKEYRTWKLDLDAMIATYEDQVSGARREPEPISLPFAPMIGCIGVAPSEGQAISTITCGPHGGNMDYASIAPGFTLHLPVSVEGALLFMGDGHALQSEGEISGTGIETSFSVRFSTDLLKGSGIAWPRGETSEHLFTIGNARPLESAVQHAVTEMLRWLERDYHLDAHRAGLLLGHAAELDVGNIISPDCTMVCKLKKSLI
jgi:acetamidase/formamidase